LTNNKKNENSNKNFANFFHLQNIKKKQEKNLEIMQKNTAKKNKKKLKKLRKNTRQNLIYYI